MVGESLGLPAIASYEIGIAELTYSLAAVLFATRPQIASGETNEHRRPTDVRAFALQRVEHFLTA